MSSMGIAGMLPFRRLTQGMRELRRWLASKIAVNSKGALADWSSSEDPAYPSGVRKTPSSLSRARLLFSLVIAISAFTNIVQAQHAPTIFYNAPNWSYDWAHTRFATPLEAFLVPWNSRVPACYNGKPAWIFAGIHEVSSAGYPPGSLYNASYYGSNAGTCVIDGGPYDSVGATVRRFAYCSMIDVNGNSADQYGYAASDYPNSLCRTGAVDPEKSRGVPTCPCKLVADPINPSTGNKFESLEVYRGSGPFPLHFTVAYNSLHGNSSIQAPSDLVLGAHRVHNYLQMIRMYSNGVTATAYALRSDGKVLGFNQSGTNWVADADVGDTLDASYAADGSIDGWMYTTGNGDQELYNGTGQLIALTTRGGFTQTLLYNSTGTLASVSDHAGRQLNFSYDSSGRIEAIQAPDGSVYGFQYDTQNNLRAITYPDTNVLTLLYGENGASANDLTGIVDESSNRIGTTKYDTSDRVISASGPNGIDQTTFTYNFNGGTFTGSVTDPLGKVETSSTQYLLGTVHPLKVTRTCTGCTTVSKLYSYDSNGYLSSSTDFNSNTTKTIYDANGLLNQQVDAFGAVNQRTTNFTWNATLRVPLTRTVSDSTGTTLVKASWSYNGTGQTTARCDADPNVAGATSYSCGSNTTAPAGVRQWTYSYCNTTDSIQCPLLGLLLAVDGPRTDVSDVTHYSYYMSTDESGCGTPGGACHRAGDLYQATNALGQAVTIIAYDKNGQIARQSNANGVVTDLTYHPRGWLLTRTVRANADGTPSANDAVTTINYKAYGSVESITDPDGVKVTYTYDAAHRLTDITDALNDRIHYTLDAAGNKTKEETFDPSGTVRRTLSRTYNTLGQLTKITDGLTNAVFNAAYSDSYDGNGNLIHSADALGIQRKQSYDGLNRLVSTIDNYNGTDPATQNAQSVFAYDALDQLQGISDPDGLSTVYGHDGLGNSTSVQSPDTGTTGFEYDAAGNVTQRTDAKGITSSSTYDVLNRRTATTYADSSLNVAYGFDEPNSVTGCSSSYPVGHLTRIVEAAVTTVYCYDAHGNVTQKRQTQGTATDSVSYGYTLADRLASMLTASGASIQYNRDGAGRISGVTVLPPGTSGAGSGNVVTAVTYLPFGPVASYTLGNGQTVTRTYDSNYALTDVVSPALNLHFHRDAMGNIDALGNAPGASPASETYHYDPLYHLTGLYDASNNPEETYTYNKTGDRLSKTGSGLATGTYNYQTGTHRLFGIGTASRVYDDNGNTTGSVIGGETFGYGYNGRNRMTVVQRNRATVGTYTYNALGQRTAKVAALPVSLNQRFVYDEGSQLLGEYGDTTRDYIWLGSLPVAVVDTTGSASTVSYVHADGLNTPRAVADVAGNTVWQLAYQGNAFGEQQPSSANGYSLNLRFPGQYYDTESGLVQNVKRDYDAVTGRYLQSDPIGLGGGLSTYSYVRSSPLQSIDPRGMDVAVVVDNNTVPVFGRYGGHAGVLIGNDNSGWDYYSKDGMVNGVQQDTHGTYATLEKFFSAQGERYKTGEVFETNPVLDARMKRWAEQHLKDEFNRYRNNCGDFVYGVLKAGFIKTNPPTMSISIPNDMLDQGSGRIDWNQPHYPIFSPKNNPDTFKNDYW